MKRILTLVLIVVGFVVAGCEEGYEGHPYGYYPYDGYHGGYRGGYAYGPHDRYYRGYRLSDETPQGATVPEPETLTQP